MDFEEHYAAYVIRDKGYMGYFICNGGKCALRRDATRFTKKRAIKYLEDNEGDFAIEDAL